MSHGSCERVREGRTLHTMRRLILVVLVSSLGTSSASAQNQNLAGIERVNILVNGLVQDSTSCGMSEDVVRRVVTSAFEGHDVTVSGASEPIVAVVSVSTTAAGNSGRCESDYQISLMARVEVAPSAAEEPIAGLLSLWSESRVVASDRRDHPDRATSGLSSLASELAAQIRLANQPRSPARADRTATQPVDDPTYRIARCRELLSSPRLVPFETRRRDLEELRCQELVVAPE